MKKITKTILTLGILSGVIVGAYSGTGLIAEEQYKQQIAKLNGVLKEGKFEVVRYERGMFNSQVQISLGDEGIIEGNIFHGPLIFSKDGVKIGLFSDDLTWLMHGEQVGKINSVTRLTGEHTSDISIDRGDVQSKLQINIKNHDDYYIQVSELNLPEVFIKGGALSKNAISIDKIQVKHDLPLVVEDLSFSTSMNLFNRNEILDKWKMSGVIHWNEKRLGKLTSKNQFEVRNHKGEQINPYLVDKDEYGLVNGDVSYTFIDNDNRISDFSINFKINDFREMLYQLDQGLKTDGVTGVAKSQIDLKTVQSIFGLSDEQLKTIKVKLTESEKIALSEETVDLGFVLEMLDENLEVLEQAYDELYIEPNWLKSLITRKIGLGIYSGKSSSVEIVDAALDEVDLPDEDNLAKNTLVNITQQIKEKYDQALLAQQKQVDFVSYAKIHGDKANVQLSMDNGKLYSHGVEIKDEMQFFMKGLDLIHN